MKDQSNGGQSSCLCTKLSFERSSPMHKKWIRAVCLSLRGSCFSSLVFQLKYAELSDVGSNWFGTCARQKSHEVSSSSADIPAFKPPSHKFKKWGLRYSFVLFSRNFTRILYLCILNIAKFYENHLQIFPNFERMYNLM